MKRLQLPVLTALALIASACSAGSPRPAAAAARAVSSPATTPAEVDPFARPAGDLVRVDQQGAVIVEVTPPDLRQSPASLNFEVALNTHSVDLSMDLAALSTLSTDNGLAIAATRWDGPRGGHHVRGTLTFTANPDGKSILAGAHKLTLTIRDLDAPTRTFEWDLE